MSNAKLATSPGYRGFFVVDRSKALELVGPEHLPAVETEETLVQEVDLDFADAHRAQL